MSNFVSTTPPMSISRALLLAGILACLTALGFVSVNMTWAEPDEKVWVAQLSYNPLPDPDLAFKQEYEIKKIEVILTPDNPLTQLNTEGIDEDEKLVPASCFVPTHKLVFEDCTYIISTYCTASRKFINSAPFVTSSKEVPSDLIFTETLLNYLEQVHAKNFRPEYSQLQKRLSNLYSNISTAAVPLDQVVEQARQMQELNADLQQSADEDDNEQEADSVAADSNKPLPVVEEEDTEEEIQQLDKDSDRTKEHTPAAHTPKHHKADKPQHKPSPKKSK
jgi:hypothetical protein